MDGLIEKLKETARAIERQREDLKNAGYHIGQAIRILEDGDDLVRVEIQEPTGKAALIERLEHPEEIERTGRGLVTEKLEPSETEDQLPKVEKIPPMPPAKPPKGEGWLEEEPKEKTEPSETRPISQQMPTGPQRYRNVSTKTAILDVLDKYKAPGDAKQIHDDLVKGGWMCGGTTPLASVRAALSAMRNDINYKKIQIGPRKITHYSLPTMEEMVKR